MFHSGNLDLTSINTAYITLIPKVQNPEKAADYRPISLVSIGLKIITKILANRLQKVIIPLIHVNQYGFIKSRTIQDCISWAFEYLNICHKSKKEIVIIKIDFEKAFDMVEYNAILEMLKHMGFGEVFVGWIRKILSSASTSVILNGVPGKTIRCKRGVRQGDPLSPLLFVSTAELLQIVINKAWHDGLISLPLDHSYGQKYPILQYADDTLIIMPADHAQVLNLKNILQVFSNSTGLKVNYHKSSLVPINTSSEKTDELAQFFGCKVEALPFTYLGLPMGTSRPKVHDLIPAICRIDKRLSGISNLLSHCSRLVVVKSIISAMPNHLMCALKVHYTHTDHIEKSMRTFLWHGKEIDKGGKCLVKWEKVCLPKSAGGLGVLNLREQNKALLIKNLYKFFNQHDIPWVNLLWNAYYQNGMSPVNQSNIGSFWWRSCLSFLEDFKRLTSCVPGNGKSVYLWEDKWQEGFLKDKFPELHSFANNKMITVSKAKDLPSGQLRDYFALPLSEIAFDQCMILKDMINNLNIRDEEKDVWKFPWNSDRYVTKKVYLQIIKPPVAPAPFKWIWKSPCLPKHKFFCWLMMQDRLNTRDLLSRKNFHVETTDCVLCDGSVRETLQHLFFACSFSKRFWEKIGVHWDIALPLMPMLVDARSRTTSPFFNVALIAGSWSLWNHRNKIIFDNEDRDQSVCFSFFKSSVDLIRLRVKPSLRDGLLIWLDTL